MHRALNWVVLHARDLFEAVFLLPARLRSLVLVTDHLWQSAPEAETVHSKANAELVANRQQPSTDDPARNQGPAAEKGADEQPISMIEECDPGQGTVPATAISSLGPAQRREVLLQVAQHVQLRHHGGSASGGVQASRIRIQLAHGLEVAVNDTDTMRPLGSRARRGSRLSTYDEDRYDFAHLAAKCLGLDEDETGLEGLSEARRHRLVLLARRACGPVGTRPAVAEWIDVLGGREA